LGGILSAAAVVEKFLREPTMMRQLLFSAAVAVSLGNLAGGNLAGADEKSEGFVPLFDGKSLAGWKIKADKPEQTGAETWSAQDGILSAKPGANWLSTTQEYGDFILRLEWRVPQNGNSGVFVHVPELKTGEHPHIQGIEIQVLDDTGPEYAGNLKPYQYSGSIYGTVPAAGATYNGPNQWNSYEITCRGELLTVVFNGKKVAEGNLATDEMLKTRPPRGFIGLQNHGTPVEYRNIRIRALKSAAGT
jgi:hypothetical protein